MKKKRDIPCEASSANQVVSCIFPPPRAATTATRSEVCREAQTMTHNLNVVRRYNGEGKLEIQLGISSGYKPKNKK